MNQTISLFASGANLKRKTIKEYKSLSKNKLYESLCSFIANYDKLRDMYLDKCVEIEFLTRKNKMLNNRLRCIEKNYSNKHHSFSNTDIMLKKLNKKK